MVFLTSSDVALHISGASAPFISFFVIGNSESYILKIILTITSDSYEKRKKELF
jgi:hypothetical protein